SPTGPPRLDPSSSPICRACGSAGSRATSSRSATGPPDQHPPQFLGAPPRGAFSFPEGIPMPLIDSAVLKVGAGNYFTAPVGTALPTDLKSPGSEWVNMGHTSLEDILAFESEGGEATVLGTLQ